MIMDSFFKNELSCTMNVRKLTKTKQTGKPKESKKTIEDTKANANL